MSAEVKWMVLFPDTIPEETERMTYPEVGDVPPCPGCGARARWDRSYQALVTEHEHECSWLSDPNSKPYDHECSDDG